MMHFVNFFFENSRVNDKQVFLQFSRFSGSRNSKNIFILMINDENRKLCNENKFDSQN